MKSFPHQFQLDAMDCGPACLHMIVQYYGRSYPISWIRTQCGIGKDGVSLLGLSEAAESMGMQTLSAKITIEQLANEIVLPCILHWDCKHFVVCYEVTGKKGKRKIKISDPALGKVTYTEKELFRHWISGCFEGEPTGLAMQIEPNSQFYSSPKWARDMNIPSLGLNSFLRYLIPHKQSIFQLLLGSVAMMLLAYASPLITQAVVDIGILGKNLRFILLMMIMQVIIAISNTSIVFVQSWISLHMNILININLIADYLKKLSQMPISFFETRTLGDILQRIGDHNRIKDFLMNDFIDIVFAFSSFVIFSIILGLYNWQILSIFLVGNLIYALWVMAFMKYRRELDNKAFRQSSMLQNNMVQFVEGMQEIKLNNIEQHKCWEWAHLQARLYKLSREGMKIGQIQSSGSILFSSVTSIAISYITATKVLDGEMSLGMMMALSFIIGQISGPIGSFIGFIHNWQDAKISMERLSDLYMQEDEVQKDKGKIALKDLSQDLNQGILLKNLSFSYNGKERKFVLKNISLHIPCGKVTAVVGASGSGKTTLIKLLQASYQPTQGDILLGNVPLSRIRLTDWRRNIGSVMQDGFLFSDTIANNITAYAEPVDQKRLTKAAQMVNMLDFIQQLPNGFSTQIGSEGIGMSQGQRQRILMARAIYKAPSYLFMDEATNALDAKNEQEIVYNLQQFYRNRTVVIAAHRLSTIRNADNIVVLQAGAVAEQGTHEELIKRKGIYYQLIQSQLG